jgi:uncharacterized protein (TIRG00374 family)
MRRVVLALLGPLLSLVAIVIVVRSVDLGRTVESIAAANPAPLAPALSLVAVGILVRSLRWQRLLPRVGTLPPVRRIAPVVLVGYLGNAVLPARLGEPIRAYLLARREGLSPAQVFGTAILERIVDLATLAVMAFAATLLVRAPGWVIQLTAVAAIGGVAVVVLLATIGLRPLLRPLDTYIARRPGGRAEVLHRRLERFASGIGGPSQRVPIVEATLLSVPIWLTDSAICWLVALALGVSLPFAGALLVVGVGALGTSIPSAPGYVGTYELAASATAVALGASSAAALGLAVVLHAITLLPVAVSGAAALLLMGRGGLLRLAHEATADS